MNAEPNHSATSGSVFWMESFAERLQRLRGERGLTQKQLADRIGVDREYISSLERGKIQDPGLDLVTKLASVVGWALFGYPGSESPRAVQGEPSLVRVLRDAPSESSPIDIPREEFIERDYDYPRPYHSGEVAVNHQLPAGDPELDTANDEGARVLRTSYRDVESGRFIVVRVRGDSMEPRLHDGDLVLVDTFDKTLRPEGIFAVYVRGEGSTLAYVHVSSGVAVITKQNPKHTPRVYHDPERVVVQGRVTKRLEESLD